MTMNKWFASHFLIKPFLALLLFATASVAWSAPQEGLKPITKDYEVENLDISFRADGIPTRVRFNPCPKCQRLDLKVSPSATFYVNGKPVPLNHTRQLTGKSGAVIYNIQKKHIEKIIFF